MGDHVGSRGSESVAENREEANSGAVRFLPLSWRRWPSGFWIGLGIFLLALTVRLIYLLEIRHFPLFSVMIGDGQAYHEWALRIAAGNWLGQEVFTLAPLYPYFLACIYAVMGEPNFVAVRVVQDLLGAASCVFLYRAGRHFFSLNVGIVAGVLLALYPPAIYFDGLIQKAVLDLFLTSLWVYGLGKITERATTSRWLVAGIGLGLLALSRPNVLVLISGVAVWGWVNFRATPWQTRGRWALGFCVGLGLVLFPVALRNQMVGGEFHLTTAQFGLNFYLGNGKRATGFYQPLVAGRATVVYEWADAKTLAERESGRPLTAAEISQFWTQKTWTEIQEQPGHWLKIMMRKWFLIWNWREIVDTEDIYTYGDWSWLLQSLLAVFHFGTLIMLATVGVIVTWQQRERLWLLYALILLFAVSVALFFVFARYRVVLVPMLTLFAAAGIVHGRSWLKSVSRPQFCSAGGALAAVALVSFWPLVSANESRSSFYCNIGAVYYERQNFAAALSAYQLAVEWNPASALAENAVAALFEQQGRLKEAETHFDRAAELNPGSADAESRLAIVLLKEGKTEAAETHFQKAVHLDAHDPDAQMSWALALEQLNQNEEALAHYATILQSHPHHEQALYNQALLLSRMKRPAEALHQYQELIQFHPRHARAHNNLGALLMEQGQWAEAVEHFHTALAIQPDLLEACVNAALALTAKGDPVAAKTEYLRAIELAKKKGLPVLAANLQIQVDTPAPRPQ